MTAKKRVATSAGNPILDLGDAQRTYDDPIKVGICGLGRIGWCHHAQILSNHNGFEIVAAADLEPDRRREAEQTYGCAVHPNLTSLLTNDAVELAIIATPTKYHTPMAIQALNAGKHVLVEKPAARTAKGIDRMIAAARQAGKVLTMHHNRRLDPDFLYVKETIDSGRLGKVFRINRAVTGFSRRNDWQVLLKYGGGMIGNWGVHLVDQVLQLLDGRVADVWSDVNHLLNPGDAEDDLIALIRGENGLVINVEMTSVNAAPTPNWVVLGDSGSLWIQGRTAKMKLFDRAKLRDVKPNDVRYALGRAYGCQPDPDTIPWEEIEEEPKPKGRYVSYYDNLYAGIRDGAALVVEPESARLTYQVLERIRRGTGF